MNEIINNYLEKFEDETKERFSLLYEVIYESYSKNIEEKLWAKLPSFYVGDAFIRLIPFKDHVNIEAKAVAPHREELKEFRITPKGMLQIFHNQKIPYEVLKKVFRESLEE